MLKESTRNTALSNSLFTTFRRAARHLTLSESFELLSQLDDCYLTYKVYPDGENPVALPFAQWGSTTDLFRPAHDAGVLWFYGGPPGRQTWHFGTVATFVTDCLADAVIRFGKKFVAIKLAGIFNKGS